MKIFVLLIGNFFKHKIFCRTGKNISFFLTLWFLLLYFRYTLQFRFYSAVARISFDTHIFVFDDLKKWLIKKKQKKCISHFICHFVNRDSVNLILFWKTKTLNFYDSSEKTETSEIYFIKNIWADFKQLFLIRDSFEVAVERSQALESFVFFQIFVGWINLIVSETKG